MFTSVINEVMQEDEEAIAAKAVDMKRRWREQGDDVMFPDEVCRLHPHAVVFREPG